MLTSARPLRRLRWAIATTFVLLAGGAEQAAATLAWTDSRSGAVVVASDSGARPRAVGRGGDIVVSPDGRLVAYAAGPRGRPQTETYVVRSDGSAPPELLAREAVPLAIAPGGDYVIADRTSDRETIGIVALPVAGGPPIVLASRPGTIVGFGSPGTVTLVVEPPQHGRYVKLIVEVSLTGAGRTRVLATDSDSFSAALGLGSRLAYVRSPRDGYSGPEIRLTNPGAILAPLLNSEPTFRAPIAWLPGGRRLIVAEVEPSVDSVTATVVDVRTGRRREIARAVNGISGVSSDGRLLLVERRMGGERILAVPVDGGRARILARNASDAAWSR